MDFTEHIVFVSLLLVSLGKMPNLFIILFEFPKIPPLKLK